jgi:hypothetical protein
MTAFGDNSENRPEGKGPECEYEIIELKRWGRNSDS